MYIIKINIKIGKKIVDSYYRGRATEARFRRNNLRVVSVVCGVSIKEMVSLLK